MVGPDLDPNRFTLIEFLTVNFEQKKENITQHADSYVIIH